MFVKVTEDQKPYDFFQISTFLDALRTVLFVNCQWISH